MRKKDKIAISLMAILIIGIVGLWGVDFSSQYLTVTDVKTTPSLLHQSIEVMGNVKEDTLYVNGTKTTFVLTDGISDINIYYRGDIVPQLAEGAKVSVRGILMSENHVDANFLVMGCPSKYGI